MKVLSAEISIVVNVDTDEKEFPTFRRYGPDCWKNLMGESAKELESLRLKLASRDAEVVKLREQVKIAQGYLERLACLGNGNRHGNSVGNSLAKEALAATEPKP